jgi:hypothetical protein
MKKIISAVAVLSLLISAPVFAEETKKEEMPLPGLSAPEAGGGMSMESSMGMPMSGMEKKCSPMMGKAQMVATDEGGVIVLAGNRLMKYDADLNLVKEADVKMPVGPMGGKQCPMMGKMMDPGAAPTPTESSEKTA